MQNEDSQSQASSWVDIVDGTSVRSISGSSDWTEALSKDGDTTDNISEITPHCEYSSMWWSIYSWPESTSSQIWRENEQALQKDDEEFAESKKFDWLDERSVKDRRQRRFQNWKYIHGKTRRHMCSCSSCSNVTLGYEVDRVDARSARFDTVYGPGHSKFGVNAKVYSVTSIDLNEPWVLSSEKGKSWEGVASTLAEHATASEVTKDYYGRKTLVFDVEVKGVVVNTRRQDIPQTETDKRLARMRVKLRPVYYSWAVANPYQRRFDSPDEWNGIARLARPCGLFNIAEVNEAREEYVAMVASFHSRRTKQERFTDIKGSMMSMTNVYQELADAAVKQGFSTMHRVFSANHNHCWASTEPPSSDYDDWFMEIDLGSKMLGGRFVRALVMQGRLPEVESCPSSRMFADENTWKKYDGPIFPVVPDNQFRPSAQQWVEKFELSYRADRGSWSSLGVMNGNVDAWNQRRIELPMIANTKIRFLRIRPLSKEKKGFNGVAPAFRVGVVASKEVRPGMHATASDHKIAAALAKQALPRDVPKGFVRYKLHLPIETISYDEQGNLHKQKRQTYSIQQRLSGASGYRRSSREQAKNKPPAKKLLRSILRDDDLI